MIEQEPSRTAYAAARLRAAHQVLDHGRIFHDPLALPILGLTADELTADDTDPARRGIRFFVAARSQVAESVLADGIAARGVTQLVVLGAGLDTFAYRSPYGDDLPVFEVDHPATQAWKRGRLAEAGIAIPASHAFAPVNFESGALLEGLAASAFDPRRRTFFTWLGVTPYLTKAAVQATLSAIAGLPGGAEVVFDYGEPPVSLSAEMQAIHEDRAARVAAVGEPFRSYFEPEDLHAQLSGMGFNRIDDFDLPRLLTRYLGPPADEESAQRRQAARRGGHVLFAGT